ncbi:hypothetical protein GGE56_004431 [Rhizobium leguminosarum]|nr:hypothetical protein [Rhizobium leguminosarum]MBB6296120.1 hypothetical protein [Rhizobium leguminosarum]
MQQGGSLREGDKVSFEVNANADPQNRPCGHGCLLRVGRAAR